jgi:hypothetical protein
MLAHRGPADRQLVGQVAHRSFPPAQDLEHPTSHRVPEGVERQLADLLVTHG